MKTLLQGLGFVFMIAFLIGACMSLKPLKEGDSYYYVGNANEVKQLERTHKTGYLICFVSLIGFLICVDKIEEKHFNNQ